MSTSDALKKAQELELDLVEIAQEAKPPVAKIIDYKKFQYLEERKQKEARKHTKETELKEVRFSPFIGEHDLEVGLGRVKKFIADGDMVKVSIVFKGRQMTHTEFGPKLLLRLLSLLEGIAEKDRDPRWEGKRYVAILKGAKGQHKQEVQKEETTEGESTKTEDETKN